MSSSTDPGTADRPNIVLVTCHDLGQYLGCYGADVETPTIDGFAEEGVRFENSFCTAPQCSPSRGSITTGKFPHRNGLMGLTHRGWALNEDETAMPERFAEAGYETALFGLQHETEEGPERLGYQNSYGSMEALSAAEHFQSEVGSLGDDSPFFAGIGSIEPHRNPNSDTAFGWQDDEYGPTPPEEVTIPGFLPENETIREQLGQMHEDVHAVDDAMGMILDALEDAGVADETVVVFVADHGIAFPFAKTTLFDAGIETSLIVRYPDEFEGGRVFDQMISNVDLLPTLLELAGQDPPVDIDGRSFLSLLRGDEYVPRDRVFAEQTFHVAPGLSRAVRTERYKYIRNYLTHVDRPGRSDGGVERDEWPEEELYDLEADPHEQSNLLETDDSGRYEGVAATLRSELYDWMERTDDPVIDGYLPLPTRERPDPATRRP